MSQAPRAAIAAGSVDAVEAGLRIARLGGNTVDIAVGAALCATASEILMCSLGGSAFVMLHLPGAEPELIDGYDAMPGLGRSPEQLVHEARQVHLAYGDGIEVTVGHGSVAVPGALGALETAWKRHGSLPWPEVMAPAVECARRGFPLCDAAGNWLEVSGEGIFGLLPASRESFFLKGERPFRGGEHVILPGLADTMEAIAREGAAAFYEGDVAASIAAEMDGRGGLITRQDLAAYRAQVRRPLRASSGGFDLALNPPPAVGGAAAGSLIGLMERLVESGAALADAVEAQVRAQNWLLDVRDHELHDEGFDEAMAMALLEPEYLARRAAALRSPNTTHMSIATRDGGLASISMSMGYGSGVTIPGTGIACNNSLGEPELNPKGFHAAEAGSRLVSNMAPTVAWHPDGRGLAMGSPGASRITTALAQCWYHVCHEGMEIHRAVEQPRLHLERWHDGIRVQHEPGLPVDNLGGRYRLRPFSGKHMFFGAVQVAAVDPRGELSAAADSRRSGVARVG
jgi:gamma-glutamyltranspeptidase/glutathione hydrolase